jgi:phosphatidylglycerophosphate synthase
VNQGKGMGLKRGLLPLEFHTATAKVPPYCGVPAADVAAVVVAFVVVTFVVAVLVEFVVVAVVITFVVAVVVFLEQEGNTKAATSIKPSPRYKIFFFTSSSPSFNYYRKYNQLFSMIFTFFPPLGYEI